MYMYESYGYDMKHGRVIAFLVKMTFWPLWPQITPGEFLEP